MCGREKQPLPAWVERAVLALIDNRQRPKGIPTKLDVHVIRWDAVVELRDRREELKDKGYEPTWDAAFETVSGMLRGTEAQGSPDAVKASYGLVQRLFKEGRGPIFD